MRTHDITSLPPREQKYWDAGIKQAPAVTQQTAPTVWQEYLEYHKQGDWLAALNIINRLTDFDAHQPEHWRLKAKLHGTMGHSICCITAITRLLELVPNDLDGLRMKAMYHHCHHDYTQALDICTNVLAQNPTLTEFKLLKETILSSS